METLTTRVRLRPLKLEFKLELQKGATKTVVVLQDTELRFNQDCGDSADMVILDHFEMRKLWKILDMWMDEQL